MDINMEDSTAIPLSVNMIWSLVMEPHKQYSQRVKESFHLTMASLDVSKADDHPTKVMMIFGGNATRYLLCTLDKKNVLQAPLNLLIEKGSFITFLCNGAGYVHLTGYLKNNALKDPNVGNIISAHIKEGITTSEQLMEYLKRDKTIKYKEGTYGAWIIKQIDTKENQENEKEANSKRKTNAPEGEAANSNENESNNDICDDCLLDSFIIDDNDDDDDDDDDYDNTLTSCYDSDDVEIKMQENEEKESQEQEKNGKQQEKGVTGEEANGKQKDKKKKKEEQRKNNTWLLPVFSSDTPKPWLWKNRRKGQLCHSLLSCSCPAWVTYNAKIRSMLRRKWPQVQTCFRVCAPRCGRRNSWNESWRKASSHNTTENGIWLCSL